MSDRPHPIHLVDEPPDDERPALPSEPTLERIVLAGCLTWRTDIDDVTSAITPADLYQPRHELILDAITHLHAGGEPVDIGSVTTRLRESANLNRVGGASYIHELATFAVAPGNAGYHAHTLAALATRRHLIRAGNAIEALGYQGAGDEHALHEAAQQHLAEVPRAVEEEDEHETAFYAAVADLEASPGLPTPWSSLTEAIAGWKPACLYLIGARPGIGKSVAGVSIATDTARRGKAALIYSLEMSRTEVYHRMIGAIGDISMTRIQHRNLTVADWQDVAKATQHILDLPLRVDDRAALSLSQIRASVLAEQRRRDVGVVVIDYLQLLTPPMAGKQDDRRVQVDSISRGLKALAKDANIPVIALTQLNRSVESRADKTPTLADLREAGGQEQDADVVLLLHRDLKESPTALKVNVAKNRHGAQAAFELFFRGEFSRIDDQQWSPSSAIGRN